MGDQGGERGVRGRGGRPRGANRTAKPQSVRLTQEVSDEAWGAIDFLRGNPAAPRSFTALVDLAVYRLLRELREQYNGGEPFPPIAPR